MDVPGNDALRARSAVLSAAFPPGGPNEEGLTALATEAAGTVSMLTGRAIGVTGAGPFECPLEEVPSALVPLATRVVRLRAERMDLMEGNVELLTERAEQLLGGLASISAGPWSESYFPPGATAAGLQALDADPELAAEMWALATECVRENWIRLWHPELGAFAPASFTQEMPWFTRHGEYREPGWY